MLGEMDYATSEEARVLRKLRDAIFDCRNALLASGSLEFAPFQADKIEEWAVHLENAVRLAFKNHNIKREK